MKIVKIRSSQSREALIDAIKSGDEVNRGVKFDEKRGRPIFRLKERGSCLFVSARYVGGDSKDNGFLVGTYFVGKIKEDENGSVLCGVVTTAPLYHLGLIALFAYFIYKCIALGGFSPVPIILLAFSLILFKDEFRKQGLIFRFLNRAARYAEEKK